MGVMVIALFRPKPGRDPDLLACMRDHLPVLRAGSGRRPAVDRPARGMARCLSKSSNGSRRRRSTPRTTIRPCWRSGSATRPAATMGRSPTSPRLRRCFPVSHWSRSDAVRHPRIGQQRAGAITLRHRAGATPAFLFVGGPPASATAHFDARHAYALPPSPRHPVHDRRRRVLVDRRHPGAPVVDRQRVGDRVLAFAVHGAFVAGVLLVMHGRAMPRAVPRRRHGRGCSPASFLAGTVLLLHRIADAHDRRQHLRAHERVAVPRGDRRPAGAERAGARAHAGSR